MLALRVPVATAISKKNFAHLPCLAQVSNGFFRMGAGAMHVLKRLSWGFRFPWFFVSSFSLLSFPRPMSSAEDVVDDKERKRLRKNELESINSKKRKAAKLATLAKRNHEKNLNRQRVERCRDRKRVEKQKLGSAAMNPSSPSPAKGNKDGGADYSPVKTPPDGYPSPNHRRGSGQLRRSPRSRPRRHRTPRTPRTLPSSEQALAMLRECQASKRKAKERIVARKKDTFEAVKKSADDRKKIFDDRKKINDDELAQNKQDQATYFKLQEEADEVDVEIIEDDEEIENMLCPRNEGSDYDSDFDSDYDSDLHTKLSATNSPKRDGFNAGEQPSSSLLNPPAIAAPAAAAAKQPAANPPAAFHSPYVVKPPAIAAPAAAGSWPSAAAKLPSPVNESSKKENHPPSSVYSCGGGMRRRVAARRPPAPAMQPPLFHDAPAAPPSFLNSLVPFEGAPESNNGNKYNLRSRNGL